MQRSKWLFSTALLGLALVGSTSWAARVVMPAVTGHVTAINNNVSLRVDGKEYMIAAGSNASKAIANVQVGDTVGLYLDGPVTQSGVHVTGIQDQSRTQ